MSKIKQLFGDTLVYGISSVITRFVNLLLLPLYTKILTPDDYGVLNIINTTFSLTWLIALMALDSAFYVYFHDKKDEQFRKSLIATWFWAQITVSTFFALSFFFFGGLFSKAFFGVDTYKPEFRLIALLLLVNLAPNIIWNWFRTLRRVHSTAVFTLIQSGLIIGLNIFFIAILRWGIKGFFWAQIIGGFVMSIAAFYILRNTIRPSLFNRGVLKKMLHYSLPLIPTALAAWGLSSAGGYFVQAYNGKTEVGLYQTGVTISGIMAFVVSAFTQAWGPFAISIKDEEGAKEFYAKIFIVYISIIGLLASIVALFTPEILRLITQPAYYGAHWVASILVFYPLLTGLNYIGSIGMNIQKNMRQFAIASIFGSIINVGLYIIGAKYLGKEGCALASLISNAGIVAYVFYAAQKIYFIPFNFKKGVMVLFFCIVSSFVGKSFVFYDLWKNYFLKTMILFLLISILYFLNKKDVTIIIKRIKTKFFLN